MISSYGETSGFSAVTSEEQMTVNGGLGFLPFLLGIAAVALGGCTQPTNSTELDGRSPKGR